MNWIGIPGLRKRSSPSKQLRAIARGICAGKHIKDYVRTSGIKKRFYHVVKSNFTCRCVVLMCADILYQPLYYQRTILWWSDSQGKRHCRVGLAAPIIAMVDRIVPFLIKGLADCTCYALKLVCLLLLSEQGSNSLHCDHILIISGGSRYPWTGKLRKTRRFWANVIPVA